MKDVNEEIYDDEMDDIEEEENREHLALDIEHAHPS